MLAYPATLMAATLITVVTVALSERAGAVAAAACVLFALWASVKNEDRLQISPAWTADGVSAGATALEDARKRFYGPSDRVTYMVFGGNSENAHAVFISDKLDLVCRWFHLYPHSTDGQLEETTECSRQEDPTLVLVTLGFFDSRAAPPKWGAFVAGARRLLDSEYELVETEHPGFEVWKRSAPAGRVGFCGALRTEAAWLGSRRGRADLALFHEFEPPPTGGGHQFLRALVGELARARGRGGAQPRLGGDPRRASSTRSTSTSRGCGGSRGRTAGWCTASTGRSASTAGSTTARTRGSPS